jgi:hypothetical protein
MQFRNLLLKSFPKCRSFEILQGLSALIAFGFVCLGPFSLLCWRSEGAHQAPTPPAILAERVIIL